MSTKYAPVWGPGPATFIATADGEVIAYDDYVESLVDQDIEDELDEVDAESRGGIVKSKKKPRNVWLAAETVRIARKGKTGPPTEADVPRPTPLPGREHKPLSGQLDLDGNETPGLAYDLDDKETGEGAVA